MNTMFDFTGGNSGDWQILETKILTGPHAIASASHLSIAPGSLISEPSGIWNLKGFVSNVRYAEKQEREQLKSIQPPLGRTEVVYASLIPMGKNELWWNMAQDERRKIFEETSHHTQIGMKYLPAVARKLFHSRDIGQPFDFITWFEYSESDVSAFEDLLAALRVTEEWSYVDREVQINLKRK